MSTLMLRPAGVVHVVVDMQRMFADETEWCMTGFHELIPNITSLAAAMPTRTLFTRFVVPHVAEHAHGRWREFYARWPRFTGAIMDPALVDVVPALASYATPDTWIDKTTYSVFEAAGFEQRLAELGADTLVFSGIETDVCVLASLMTAIDRGYRVVAVADALGSSSAAGHEATMRHVLTRMPDQVEIVDTACVLAALAHSTAQTEHAGGGD